jgi:hypothetical protein
MNGLETLLAEGPNEIRMIVEQILPLAESHQLSDSRHQIWKIMPHSYDLGLW